MINEDPNRPLSPEDRARLAEVAHEELRRIIQGALTLRVFSGEAMQEHPATLLSALVVIMIHELLKAAAGSGASVETINAMIGKAVDTISHTEYEKWRNK